MMYKPSKNKESGPVQTKLSPLHWQYCVVLVMHTRYKRPNVQWCFYIDKNIKSMTSTLITVSGITFLYNKYVPCNNRNQPDIPTISKLQYILIIYEAHSFWLELPILQAHCNLNLKNDGFTAVQKVMHFFCVLLLWESFNFYNFGTTGRTGPIHVGFSAKCTSPNDDFNQIENWKCAKVNFRLIPLDHITSTILYPVFGRKRIEFSKSGLALT